MSIINKQRDHELIVFDLSKVLSEDCIKIKTKVSYYLNVSVSLSEIARVFRILGRNSSSSPLVIKFTTRAKRNELIARAHRRDGLNASDVCS